MRCLTESVREKNKFSNLVRDEKTRNEIQGPMYMSRRVHRTWNFILFVHV